MSKTKKIWLGIFTFAPILFLLLYMLSFFVLFFGVMLLPAHEGGSGQEAMPLYFLSSFFIVFAIMGIAVILSLALLIYYIIHITQNPKFDSNEKLLWVLVIVFTHQVGYIIYWFLKIWKEEDEPKAIDKI